MDILNQSGQQSAPAPASQSGHTNKQVSRKRVNGKALRVLSGVLLITVSLLLGALTLYLSIGGTNSEAKYVDETKFQAVFLNGGQVYFGKVRTLNNRFITIDNIYYLRVNQQVQPNQSETTTTNQDVSLAKLGCELHGPTDVMVINRDQVLFWENLKEDGQVAQAISKYVQANPEGQKCQTNSTTTPTNQ